VAPENTDTHPKEGLLIENSKQDWPQRLCSIFQGKNMKQKFVQVLCTGSASPSGRVHFASKLKETLQALGWLCYTSLLFIVH